MKCGGKAGQGKVGRIRRRTRGLMLRDRGSDLRKGGCGGGGGEMSGMSGGVGELRDKGVAEKTKDE